MEVEMAARGEGDEITTRRSHQFVRIDAFGLMADPLDADLHHAPSRDHSSYPKSAPSCARMKGAPTSTQDSSGGNRSDTARTMNTSGSVTPFGLVPWSRYAPSVSSSSRRVMAIPASLEHRFSLVRSKIGETPLWQAPSWTHSPGNPENQVVCCDW